MNFLDSFLLVGGTSFNIASTFFVTGLIPFLVIQYPKYSSSAWQKEHLDAFIFRPASNNWFEACSRCSRCSLKSIFDIISKPSRYAQTNSNPTISLLIFSWKISGLLHSPIESLRYSYFPQGSTTVHSCDALGVSKR